MEPILTAEDVVRRIAAECAFVDERGGVGIRLRPAARSCGGMVASPAKTHAALAETAAAAVTAPSLFFSPTKVVMGHYLADSRSRQSF
jgi:hypothetical protein